MTKDKDESNEKDTNRSIQINTLKLHISISSTVKEDTLEVMKSMAEDIIRRYEGI